MEKLMQILGELRPDVDFTTEEKLIDNEVLDSFDTVSYTHLDVYKRQTYSRFRNPSDDLCREQLSRIRDRHARPYWGVASSPLAARTTAVRQYHRRLCRR